MVRVSLVALVLGLSALPAGAQYVGRKAGPDDGTPSTPDGPSRFAPEPRPSQPFQSTPTPSSSPSPAAGSPSPSSPSPSTSSRFAPDYGRSLPTPSYSAPPSDTGYGSGGNHGYRSPSSEAYQPYQPPPPPLPTVTPRNVMVPDPFPQSLPDRMQAPQAGAASPGTRWNPSPSSGNPYSAPQAGRNPYDPAGVPGLPMQPMPTARKSYSVPMPRPPGMPWGPEAPPPHKPPTTAANGTPPVPPTGMAQTPPPGGQRPPRPGMGGRPQDPAPSRLEVSNDDLQRLRGAYGAQRKLDDRQVAFRRPDGVEVINEYDPKGHLRRRFRRHPDGHERPLIDSAWLPTDVNPYADGYAGVVGLAPPVFPERSSDYVINVGPDAAPSPEAMTGILDGAPIEPLARAYALEEIVTSLPLRQRMPRAELEAQIFPANSSTPSAEGAVRLEGIASTMRAILLRSPDEIFLVEGHTDTAGDEAANLALSLRRAEAVAAVLTQNFGIPAENLVTQGYGEAFPLDGRPGTDLRNRRITVRRITPLLRPPTGA